MATQAEQITALAQRIGQECKTIHDNMGSLDSLTTEQKTSIVAAINELKEALGEGNANDISYGNYGYDNVEQALDALLYKAIAINSFTNNVGTVEMGSTVTDVTLNWSCNKTPTSLTLDGEPLTATDTSKVLSGQSITQNKTWTLKATDEKSASAQKTTSIQFLNGVYYGVSSVADAGSINSAFILGLTKNLAGSKTKTFTVNAGSGEYIYYAVPKRFGKVSFNVGGFDGGFTLLTTISFTNASSYSEEYDVYKSDNPSLGNTTVTAK